MSISSRMKIFIGVVLAIASFVCGVAAFVSLRALDSNADLKGTVRALHEEKLLTSFSTISRLGVVESIKQDEIVLSSTRATNASERIIFKVTNDTRLIRRTPTISNGMIRGFTEEPGSFNALRVGMIIHTTIAPEGDHFVAHRILYGDPFPIP